MLLKFALERMLPFSMTFEFWKSVFVNWQFAACGLCYGAGSILWFYIVKHFPFSMAYPLVSLSYVFGMIAAIVFFIKRESMAKLGALALPATAISCGLFIGAYVLQGFLIVGDIWLQYGVPD